jgi:hypothetical protein
MTKRTSDQRAVLRAVVAGGGEGVAIAERDAADVDEQWLQRDDGGYAITLAGQQV